MLVANKLIPGINEDLILKGTKTKKRTRGDLMKKQIKGISKKNTLKTFVDNWKKERKNKDVGSAEDY